MKRNLYTKGFLNSSNLICEENGIITYSTTVDQLILLVICDKNEKSMILKKRGIEEEKEKVVSGNEIEENVVKQMSEDGSRWEGDWYNGNPFGFGSFYDEEGNRMYSGFVFEGKKVGYGTEFFADSHIVDYCGNFINDQRYGWGCSYDRNGQKLFEGEWVCGRNDFDTKVVIQDKWEGEVVVMHNLIRELDIGNYCLNDVRGDVIIRNYPHLETISIKDCSLKNANCFKIMDNAQLKSITIKDGIFFYGSLMNVNSVVFESIVIDIIYRIDLPNLQSFNAGKLSLRNTTSLSLSSIFLVRC